ncbi:MAG: ADP-ribosyltransferase [Bacteroidia bacterium]
MERLIELFEICEDKRHEYAISINIELFPPERGINYYKFYHERFLQKVKNHNFGGTTETGENLDAIVENGLTHEEASIIYMYTHHHIYNNLNYLLRYHSHRLDEDILLYKTLLNAALTKLNQVNNSIIYRDIRNPDNGVENCLEYYEMNIGNTITFNDFLSCHTDNIRISDINTDYQFVIETSESSRCMEIQKITLVQNEKEVLFQSGTNFITTKVDKENNQVFMKEV